MIALLLAQLVMPSPSVEPLSPPGMICMGECSDGPMVWRASPARGRLVVACDMTSDTCSDGRKITTTRSTPVPCEVAPGQWEMVPENTGCYGVRGLESWAATTSYLSFGAELDRSPWFTGGVIGHSVSVDRTGGTNLMCQNAELGPNSPAGIGQTTSIPTTAGPQTLACIARPSTGSRIRLNSGVSALAEIFQMEETWDRYAHTIEVEEGQGSTISVYTLGQTCIDIAACWLTKTDTPGRPCWGGEAPVTCGADRHTISTEGWPTEAGEISVAFVSGDPAAPDRRTLFAGGAASSCRLWTTSSGNLQIANCPGWSTTLTTTTVSIQEGRPYVATIKRRDGKVSIWLDGVMQVESERPPFVWDPSVNLGTTGTQNHLNGSIRSLTVRSFE